jgi:hypothetical protein
MANLDTIIALASKIYIAKLHAYKLDQGMRNSSTLSMDARVFHYTYDRG